MSSSRNLAMASASALSALTLLFAPLAATAQKAKVVVIPYAPLYDSIPRATGEQIAQTLESGLSGKSNIELVKLPGEGSDGNKPLIAATPAQIAAVEGARAEVERANGLLAKRRVKPAQDAYKKAIAAFEANGPALLDVSPLVEANLKMAVTYFLMGNEDQAVKGPIPAALRLNPGLRLEAGAEYQQVFIDQVEKVRQELLGAGHGSLRVDTTPPGAKVDVDDRDAAYSPVMISGLLPGKHYVRIKPPGADPYIQVVEIKKGETFRITPDDGKGKEGPVGALVTLMSKNQLDDGVKKQLQALTQKAGAQQAVVGGAYAQGANMGIVSYLYSAKDNSFVELQKLTLDRDMLGATIEINKIANELESRVSEGGTKVTTPRPMAEQAKAGDEKINEVDFSGDLAAGAAVAAEAGKDAGTTPAAARGSAGRRPITRDEPRKPLGGGLAPEASAAPVESSTDTAVAVAPVGAAGGGSAGTPSSGRAPAGGKAPAPAPAVKIDDSGLAFRDDKALDFAAPEPAPEQKYRYAAGTSIEDESAFDQPVIQKEGGLLTKWWFWTGVGVLAAGAVTAGVAASGSSEAPAGRVTW